LLVVSYATDILFPSIGKLAYINKTRIELMMHRSLVDQQFKHIGNRKTYSTHKARSRWCLGSKARQGAIAPPINFGLAENFLLLGNYSSKNAKFGAKSPISGKFKGKIEILRTHNLFCQKFAAVCPKMVTSCLLF